MMHVDCEADSTPESEGVWQVFIKQPQGRRLLDGEATDGKRAIKLYNAALETEPHGTCVELVHPNGVVVLSTTAPEKS